MARAAETQRLATAAIGLLLSASIAQAECPADLDKVPRVVLAAGDTYRREIVRNPDGTLDVIRKMPALREPSTTTLLRGLIPLRTKAPQVGEIEYATDPTSVFPLKVGDKHTLPYKGKTARGDAFDATMTIDVRTREDVTIGACKFETFVIARTVRFASGQRTPTFIEFYAPSVGFIVRGNMVTSDGALATNANEVFDTITASRN